VSWNGRLSTSAGQWRSRAPPGRHQPL